VMVFDTAAGELAPEAFTRLTVPDLTRLAEAFPNRLGYYAKGIRTQHVNGGTRCRDKALCHGPWAGLGLDMHWDLASALLHRPCDGFVQRNFDPASLLLTGSALERAIDQFLTPLRDLDPGARRGWICGLGHGVLPATPEDSVRTFVVRVRETLG